MIGRTAYNGGMGDPSAMGDVAVLTTITASINLVKTGIDALRSALEKAKGRGDSTTKPAVIDALALASDLQARVFQLEKEALRLEEENRQLRAEVGSRHEWLAERQRYMPTKVGQATVLVRDDRPGLYFCPTCFDESRDHPVPLQPHVATRGSFGSHMCTKCGHGYRLGQV